MDLRINKREILFSPTRKRLLRRVRRAWLRGLWAEPLSSLTLTHHSLPTCLLSPTPHSNCLEEERGVRAGPAGKVSRGMWLDRAVINYFLHINRKKSFCFLANSATVQFSLSFSFFPFLWWSHGALGHPSPVTQRGFLWWDLSWNSSWVFFLFDRPQTPQPTPWSPHNKIYFFILKDMLIFL